MTRRLGGPPSLAQAGKDRQVGHVNSTSGTLFGSVIGSVLFAPAFVTAFVTAPKDLQYLLKIGQAALVWPDC